MLDKWFLEDIDNKMIVADRIVVVDENRQADFLFEHLKKLNNAEIFHVFSEIDELKTKYQIEKNYSCKAIIISAISLNKLKFMREYAETGGCLHIKNLDRYIRQMVKEKMDFDLDMPTEKIIALGKLSIGKGKEYWNRIKIKGNIFTEEEILAFLAAPEKTYKSYDQEVKNLFVDFMSEFTEYSLSNKPPDTVAKEISSSIFANLLYKRNNTFLNNLYKKWSDSKKYEQVLQNYIKGYSLSEDLNIWNVPIDHPFNEIDLKWLKELIKNINNKKWIEEKIEIFLKRAKQDIVDTIGVQYWEDIAAIFSYHLEDLNQIQCLQDAVNHYKESFSKIDQAIRHFITFFLNEKDILQPFQEYYRILVNLYLKKWFAYFQNQFQQNQTGLLKKIIMENKSPLAIIVGDAISYEIAMEIYQKIKENSSGEYHFKMDAILGDFPSVTDNNMTRLFTASNKIYENRSQREKNLKEEAKNKINFYDLNNVSISHIVNDYSVFYLADMDSISEKEGQNALKYYNTIIENTCEKINCLFKCGYKKVCLVSDHGFVLTGILDEADKINLKIDDGEKYERYCLSRKNISNVPDHVLEFRKPYKEYEFIYFSSTLNPFKTTGPYGFSHGGITPQELLIPFMEIEKSKKEINNLKIEITNKEELKNITGDIYPVRLKAGLSEGDMFSRDRRVIIVMVNEKEEFSQSDVINIHEKDEILREFNFKEYNEFEIVVLDAQTKTRLDYCNVKRNIARDLGGLT